MTVPETTKAPEHTLSGEANGRIWGMRAADWSTIQEPQCASAYQAVFVRAPVGSETRILDAGCGAGLATAAGLSPQEVFDVDAPWAYPDLETAQKGLGSSGVAVKAVETSGQEALDAAHAAALAPFRQPDGSYRVGATFRVLMAQVEA